MYNFSRWKDDKPLSRSQFDRTFPDDAACARHLFEVRWPGGFSCPACGNCGGWELKSRRFTWECTGCHKQTSVTAGTVMHRSKVPLRKWFELAHMMTSHSNGVSAEQAHAQLGLGSYVTAWLMLQKMRRAMVNPERTKLQGTVEVDEATVVYRTTADPVAGGQGRSAAGKLAFVVAVELSDGGKPRRIRMEPIADYTAETLHGFVQRNVAAGSTVRTDGNPSYRAMEGYTHQPKVVGKMAAHIVLKWVHRVISNLKRWFMGTLHGVRRPYFQAYLDEFTFRWNRRKSFSVAFFDILDYAVTLGHSSRDQIVASAK